MAEPRRRNGALTWLVTGMCGAAVSSALTWLVGGELNEIWVMAVFNAFVAALTFGYVFGGRFYVSSYNTWETPPTGRLRWILCAIGAAIVISVALLAPQIGKLDFHHH